MATKEEIVEIIKTIVDPELFIDIWTLGLIYDIAFDERKLLVKMTFTSMACPAGPQLVGEIKERTVAHEDIDETEVEVVFQPPWEPSEDLKAMLGIA